MSKGKIVLIHLTITLKSYLECVCENKAMDPLRLKIICYKHMYSQKAKFSWNQKCQEKYNKWETQKEI